MPSDAFSEQQNYVPDQTAPLPPFVPLPVTAAQIARAMDTRTPSIGAPPTAEELLPDWHLPGDPPAPPSPPGPSELSPTTPADGADEGDFPLPEDSPLRGEGDQGDGGAENGGSSAPPPLVPPEYTKVLERLVADAVAAAISPLLSELEWSRKEADQLRGRVKDLEGKWDEATQTMAWLSDAEAGRHDQALQGEVVGKATSELLGRVGRLEDAFQAATWEGDTPAVQVANFRQTLDSLTAKAQDVWDRLEEAAAGTRERVTGGGRGERGTDSGTDDWEGGEGEVVTEQEIGLVRSLKRGVGSVLTALAGPMGRGREEAEHTWGGLHREGGGGHRAAPSDEPVNADDVEDVWKYFGK